MSKPRKKYVHLQDGEWLSPSVRGFSDQCCDCGLVHKMDFRVNEGQIEFRARVDKRATAAARRAFKFPKEAD